MRRIVFLLCLSVSHLVGQTGNACDIDGNGKVEEADAKKAATAALHGQPCKPNGPWGAVCNVVAVQRIYNAARSKDHKCNAVLFVNVRWTSKPGVPGYNIYRKGTAAKLNPRPLSSGAFLDELPIGSAVPAYQVRPADKEGKDTGPPINATAK